MPTLYVGKRLHPDCWLLLAMLGVLHGVMVLGVLSLWAYPVLMAHLTLFLLWQPLRRKKHRVRYGVLACTALTALFWLNWWAIAFWLCSLFGLVGARAFALRERWARMLYMSAMAYLFAALLLWVAPNLFGAQGAIKIGYVLMCYVLPLLLLSVPALSLLMSNFFPKSYKPDVEADETALSQNNRQSIDASRGFDDIPDHSASLPKNHNITAGYVECAQTVNFIYSLLLFMLLTLVTLGSLAFMSLAELDYHEALLRTLLLAGLVWFLLGALWYPHFGFSGLKYVFSHYLLNVGTPFESWFTRLAEAAQNEPDPASYLRNATKLLADVPWLSGLSWQSPDGTGQLGQFSKHVVQSKEGELRLTIYARQSLNPVIMLHIFQLAQLVGYFYQAKQREQSLRNITRLQAVYETGSRLTHDLKNMLQSLLCLTELAQSREQRAQQLLQQQLPMLTQRIELTLNKLQQPQSEYETSPLAFAAWWDALRLRNRHQIIEWRAPDILPSKKIPAALFDCALDNLLDNALKKRQFQPGISITVALYTQTDEHAITLRLTVCDSGAPIPEDIVANLLRGVIVSGNGLGIGVYQVARWAEQLGYSLTLNSNQAGKVCFELRG